MSMVNIGIVRMKMRNLYMVVFVAMRFSSVPLEGMLVLMMLVMSVAVTVR